MQGQREIKDARNDEMEIERDTQGGRERGWKRQREERNETSKRKLAPVSLQPSLTSSPLLCLLYFSLLLLFCFARLGAERRDTKRGCQWLRRNATWRCCSSVEPLANVPTMYVVYLIFPFLLFSFLFFFPLSSALLVSSLLCCFLLLLVN